MKSFRPFHASLVLLVMAQATVEYWDDETFRTVTVGPSYSQVVRELEKIFQLLPY